MPIVDLDTEEGLVPSVQSGEKRVFRTQQEMKTSTLFNRDRDLDDILQYVSGMDWTVDYFLQIRDINDTVGNPDINVPATQQKYNRINKLIIKLQSPITQNDPDNITGEAIINCGFLPNVGDAFIATLTGGREAIFVLTELTNKTYNLHDAYDVSFKLFALLDTGSDLYNDLLYKTMKEYTYDKEHLLDFSAPIILASDYKRKLNLKDSLEELIQYYFLTFIRPDKNLIALPTRASVYIDTLLNDFIFKIIDVSSNSEISNVTRIDLDLSNEIKFSVWDAILSRNTDMLKRVTKNIDFKYTPFSVSNANMRHASYLGINFVAGLIEDPNCKVFVDYVQLGSDQPFTPPVKTDDNNYVLSENFYTLKASECGILEQTLIQYMKGEVINAEQIETMLAEYHMWDTLDQFYLIPILIVLIKDTVNNTFTSL